MPKAFDAQNPPFDRLTPSQITRLRDGLDIAYFPPGQVIIEAGKPSDALYVVIKGEVEERDGEDVEAVLGLKQSFDARALVHGGSTTRFVASEETLAYAAPRDLVLALIQENSGFAAFFYSDISRRLEAIAKADETEGVDSVLRARIGEANIRPAVFVEAELSIEDAGQAMRDADTNALLVRDGERVGVVTGMNLSKGVILERRRIQEPIRDLTRFDMISVDADDFVFEALMKMTRHNKRRLVVTHKGAIKGFLEDIDILGLFAGNSQLIPGRIDRARTVEDLTFAATDIQRQVERLHHQGVKVEVIAEMTSDLNRLLFAKLFDIVAPPAIREQGALMIMGSEGRGEQTVRTDQDNGLLLAEPVDPVVLDAFRADFTDALERFGFPPCPGNVMVRNPIWSQTIADFERQVRGWVLSPNAESPMWLGIFVDAVGVAGRTDLVPRAKATLFSMLKGEAAYLAQFAKAVDQFPGPSGGLVNSIMATVGRDEVIDLKKSGVFPIVHGIRCLAIEKGIDETSTVSRIEALAETSIFGSTFKDELIGAFRYLMALRLKSQLAASKRGSMEDEAQVRLSALTTLDRDLMRDSLRIVKQFREVVRNHFKLGLF